jgi:peptidoglycan/xylan/chitin deacetylase (PgdA/CDA1 family)
MAEPLARIRIETDLPRLAWADGLAVSAPRPLAALLGASSGRARLPAAMASDGAIAAAARDAATALRERAAYTPTPPASSRTPVSYRRVPGVARMLIAHAIGRVQRARAHRWASFPGWPLDLSVDAWSDLAAATPSLAKRFGGTPILLTHDIDSPEGLEKLEALFLPVEERHGARSCNFVVPCAWPVDAGILAAVRARGHEIGVHGFDHANRTAFAPDAERRARLDAGERFAERWGAAGYRAPSLLRTPALLADLSGRFRFDSSIPTSGGPFPVPNNGSATARPYRMGGLWELPLSLPRDGSLRFLGHGPAEIADLWLRCADRIARADGLVCLLTHCETSFSGNPAMLAAYERTLAALAADPRFRFMTPSALVAGLESKAPEPCLT